eukprot:9474891-Pyramimonas_sp.AAC.1
MCRRSPTPGPAWTQERRPCSATLGGERLERARIEHGVVGAGAEQLPDGGCAAAATRVQGRTRPSRARH